MIALDSVELTLPSAAGPVHILRGLDLIVQRGETVRLVGPSGSGQSSMMMIIAGMERASSGAVSVVGTRSTGLDQDSLAPISPALVRLASPDFPLPIRTSSVEA